MRPKVFAAQAFPEAALDVLRQVADVSVYPYLERQISVDELVAAARRSDWLYVLHETSVTAEVINANPGLKGIGCMAAGHSFIDMEAANARKIPVVMGDPAISVIPATGDLTIAMVLALAYRMVEGDRYTRCGKFRQEQTIALMGIGCPGKTVGIVGMGKLAVHMVPRLRAFEMNVIYNKPTRLEHVREQELGVEWAPSLLDLMRRSDFVCIACRYGPSTHKLIGKRELDAMRPSAYLINTGRGRIVDEPELICALREKRIAGAGLDVYWNEPYRNDDPDSREPWVPEELCTMDNVVLAPHNGGATWDVRGRKAVSVAEGMLAVMRGERPKTLINPEIYA
jgi:lactate dehydrogenase-like 2-hydroxyacid dehydrogenase